MINHLYAEFRICILTALLIPCYYSDIVSGLLDLTTSTLKSDTYMLPVASWMDVFATGNIKIFAV